MNRGDAVADRPAAFLRRWASAELAVFALGMAGRLLPVLRFGSFNGNPGYDAGVYYAGSSALLHGRIPYRDFVLLHPPGILLADAPFAVLGRFTSDHIGFMAASLAAAVVGGVNAVLVMRIARRLGLDRPAVVAGGVVYALWFGSIVAEYLPRLEPLGNLLMLSGSLALLAAHQGPPDRRHRWLLPLLGGACLAMALSVKLWWAIPVAVIIGWLVVAGRDRRAALVAGLGAVIVALVVDGPFLLAAGSRMPTMVVADQLGRLANNTHKLRVASFLSIGSAGPNAPVAVAILFSAVAAMVLAWVAVRAWRHRAARVAVILLGAQLVQIVVQPSWFTYYADFLTIALALTVAAAVQPSPGTAVAPADGTRRRRVGPVAVGAVAVALLPLGLSPHLIGPFPRQAFTAAVAHARCVTSDAPIALIQTNTLTRDLHNGCELWVDVTGKLYGADRPDGDPHRTSSYKRWQADVTRYFRSGDVLLELRAPSMIRIDRASWRRITRGGLIVQIGDYAVYRTPRRRPTPART